MRILVTGANGQVGSELQDLVVQENQGDWTFVDRTKFDLADIQSMQNFFKAEKDFDAIINCAAYTQVDKAESDTDKALAINAQALNVLATYCKEKNALLIHYSTDYVFDGNNVEPYLVDQKTAPINAYGMSKWKGEQEALLNPRTIVIRTSWVYSTHGHNFVKTMLRLSKEKTELSIVADQNGAPTYAHDLAKATIHILQSKIEKYGIFHFTNAGSCTWYDFAKKIFELQNISIKVNAVDTSSFPTLAKRPSYSVLDCRDIITTFAVAQPTWEDALQRMLEKYNQSK